MKDLQDYEEQNTLSPEEKIKYWGEGEWVNEPDFVSFTYKGIRCEIKRIHGLDGPEHIFGGHLCAYCYIPEGHPFYRIDSENWLSGLDAYMGITYNEYDDKTHLVGFDCAHSGDIVPSVEVFKKTIPDEFIQQYKEIHPDWTLWECTYKNINFVI
jgi:hypothetical protein